VASSLLSLTAATHLDSGPYTDALSMCLVKYTTTEDKTLLVEWLFATMSLHPAVQAVTTVSDNTRTQLNRSIAGIMQRLLTESCRAEARLALQYEGGSSFEASFGVLGQVAAREIFGNPQVAAGAGTFMQYVDTVAIHRAMQPADSQ
jgi:hypothetical protein